MSLKNYLTTSVMLITMFLFVDLNPVNAARKIDCTGAFKIKTTLQGSIYAKCNVDTIGNESYKCDLDQCHYVNYLRMDGCVPVTFYGGQATPSAKKKFYTYGYYDTQHYTCRNKDAHDFICNHWFTDRPVISCDC
ncbi:uncharacterized protein MELLADRAFT_123852 [Melampsora larici-populina 98AG31]|uniref:Secreted protein n=1 Tax=Melampsora larici-populina (strain 98AG31 / pathotype 3-4-7) TaxID=747676 RepID=F4S5N4_MELLP|nr:uncharacterized protein MELLADRAFT_123852 [Melampsora larici-populina 98AG31]EGG00079.1 secreted protein [Melampsora larici-populina 98AG31]